VVAGASADVVSSYGRQELVPLYRGPDGRFGARGLAIRGGLVTGVILTSWAVMRKHPNAKGPAIANFGVGSGLGLLAVKNSRVGR